MKPSAQARTASRHATSRRQGRGVTIVEALLTLSTLAFTLSAGLPGLGEARARRQLEGTAAQVTADIGHARSLAVSLGAAVRFTVQQDQGGSCYVIHTGSSSSCTCSSQGSSTCQSGAQVLHLVNLDATQAVRMGTNSRSMLFDPNRGTITPTGTITLIAADGKALNLVVNIMGRVRSCAPGQPMPGFPAC
jgi:type IV fimbrial biogenesis protein FimT